ELVRLSITRVERGGDHRARIQVPADIQVEKPIVVVVGPGGNCGDRVSSKARLLGYVSEGPVAVVMKQHVRTKCAADKQILESIVVIVAKHGRTDSVEAGETGLHGHIFKRSVAAIAEELRFNAIGNEEITETVIVVVDGGDASGPVADHSKLQRLRQERRIVPISKINAGFARHVAEGRRVGNHPIALDEALRCDAEFAVLAVPYDSKVGAINAGVLLAPVRPDVLKTDAGH